MAEFKPNKTVKFSQEQEAKWAMAVGQLILNFGNLEFLAFQLIYLFGEKPEEAYTLKLGGKIDVVIEIINRSNLSLEQRQRAIDLWKEVKQNALVRNVTAHSPWLMKEEKDGQFIGGFLDIRITKGFVPGTEFPLLNLGEIARVLQRTVVIYEELRNILNGFDAPKTHTGSGK